MRSRVELPSPLFNLKRWTVFANVNACIPIRQVLNLNAHCSRALGRTTTNQIAFFASPDGYSDHVGLRVCDSGAESADCLPLGWAIRRWLIFVNVCAAMILQGLECKALRRTSCVQAWLSLLMSNVFYFWAAMALPGDDLSVLKIWDSQAMTC